MISWSFCVKDLRIGFKMTNPLSQNTGIETIQPINNIANSGCFFPTNLTTTSAIFTAAPVFSTMNPISAAKMITIPMPRIVFPKPSLMTPATVSIGNAKTAKAIDTAIIEMKGWILNLEIMRIITTMATTRPTNNELISLWHRSSLMTSIALFFPCNSSLKLDRFI